MPFYKRIRKDGAATAPSGQVRPKQMFWFWPFPSVRVGRNNPPLYKTAEYQHTEGTPISSSTSSSSTNEGEGAQSLQNLDASPMTPTKQPPFALIDLHTITPASHQVLAHALEQQAVQTSSRLCRHDKLDHDHSLHDSSKKSLAFSASLKRHRFPRMNSSKHQSFAQLRAESDLVRLENEHLKRRLSQLEMAQVERNCLQTKINDLEWALDVLRDDADRIRDDALSLLHQDYENDDVSTGEIYGNIDKRCCVDLDDCDTVISPDDLLFEHSSPLRQASVI